MSEVRVVDLFAGMGGLGTGFSKYFDVQTAVDFWDEAVQTYRLNHKDTQVKELDVRDINFSKKDYEIAVGFIGGPPCQGFSSVSNNHKKEDDERNNSIYEMYRVAEELLPDFVLLENVQGVSPKIKIRLVKLFEKLGYKVEARNIECYDYGSVQIAQRWVLVASLHRTVFPEPLNTKRTASEILTGQESQINPYKSTIDKIKRIEVYDGRIWYKLPDTKTGYNYCMVQPDQPIGKILNFTKARYVRPDREGYLSAHEIKLAQGFPEDYQIFADPSKSKSDQLKSIGQQLANAVPVETSEVFAKAIFDSLELN